MPWISTTNIWLLASAHCWHGIHLAGRDGRQQQKKNTQPRAQSQSLLCEGHVFSHWYMKLYSWNSNATVSFKKIMNSVWFRIVLGYVLLWYSDGIIIVWKYSNYTGYFVATNNTNLFQQVYSEDILIPNQPHNGKSKASLIKQVDCSWTDRHAVM